MYDNSGSPKVRDLVARVETVALTAVPEPFRDNEIRMTVRARAEGLTPAQYLEASRDARSGEDLVALVSLGTVNSPDQVDVQEVRLAGDRLSLRARVRHFQGRLAANVQCLAIVIVDLGTLSPGRYRVGLRIDRCAFTEYERPETATFEGSATHHLQFEVAGG